MRSARTRGTPAHFWIECDGTIKIGQRTVRFIDVAFDRPAIDRRRGRMSGPKGFQKRRRRRLNAAQLDGMADFR